MHPKLCPARLTIAATFLATALGFSSAAHAKYEGPPPGQIVVTIDPSRDLVSTTPGWSREVETKGPRGTSGCLERHIEQSPPLASQPFSTNEVARLAKTANRLVTLPTPAGRLTMVRDKKGKLIPVATYTSQLNAIESFLNTFGRSLRERANDLGRVAELRNANLSEGCSLKANQYKPVWRDPRTPIAELMREWRVVDEVPGWLTSMQDLQRLERVNQLPFNRRGDATRPVMGRDVIPDEGAIAKLNGRKAIYTIPAGEIAPTNPTLRALAATSAERSGRFAQTRPLIELRRDAPRMISYWVDGEKRTTSTLQGDCEGKIIIDTGSQNNGISLGKPGGTSSGGTAPEDNKARFIATAGGTPSACLNDGVFDLSLEVPWNGCITTGGSLNNWFGGASCVSVVSNNTGNNGVMAFESGIGLSSAITVFGKDMDLLRVDAVASSDSIKGVSQNPPQVSGLVKDLGGGTTCCKPIPGPSMYIPIGFTGLLVSSGLNLTMDAGQMTTAAAPVPKGCNPGPVPVVSIAGSAKATAGVTFEASMTVVVASAGIGGDLTLVGGDLSGKIATTADMGNNLVTVQPDINFVSDIGKGEVYAFVDVDLLVYSKRWAITLAQWEGLKTERHFQHDPGTVRASKSTSQELICSP